MSGFRPAQVRPGVYRIAPNELGYAQRRPDDCFAAAVATACQVPIEALPDIRIDKRLGRGEDPDLIARELMHTFARWALLGGLEMYLSEDLPLRRRRWVGIVPGSGDFTDHCLVLDRDGELIWDPMEDWDPMAAEARLALRTEPLLRDARRREGTRAREELGGLAVRTEPPMPSGVTVGVGFKRIRRR